MKKMLQKMAILSLMAMAMLFSQKALAETKSNGLEIIVDVSGSMNEVIGGKSKMNIAKEVLTSTINSIPDTSYVGLRAYGHQGTVAQKNCTDTQLLVPISKVNKTELINKVNSLTPNGWTPIDYSLRQSKNDFHPDYGKVIILISDGEETCGGDPCSAIKELKNAGFDVTVHTVGFDVGDVAEKQLKCIAEATGGEYKSAKNAGELADSLRVFSTRAFQGYETAGGVTAGTGFTNAPLVTPGKYGGDVLVEENKFYKVNAKKGQEIVAVLNIRRETALKNYLDKETKGINWCYGAMKPAIKIYDKYQSQTASGNGKDGQSWEGKAIAEADVSLNSFKANWTADSAGEVFISLSNSWQYSPSAGCKDHQNPKYQKALYDLVIAVEGEGEEVVAPIQKSKASGNADDLAVPTKNKSSSKVNEEKGNGIIFIVIAIGVLLILIMAGVIFFLIRRKNSAISENMPVQNIPSRNPLSSEINQSNSNDSNLAQK